MGALAFYASLLPSGFSSLLPSEDRLSKNARGSEDVKNRKLLRKLLASPHNVRFGDLCKLAQAFGYRLDRVSGSHHIFEHSAASRPLNLQNVAGKAKPYQIRQFLRDIEEFHLTLEE